MHLNGFQTSNYILGNSENNEIMSEIKCSKILNVLIFLTSTLKKKYAKLSIFKLKLPLLVPSPSSLLLISLVKKSKHITSFTKVNCRIEEALGTSMETTLLVTNKLAENLFHENKCFFYMFSVAFEWCKISVVRMLG